MRGFWAAGWIIAAGLHLLFAPSLWAQDTRFFDPEGNPLSEAEYRVMISRWKDCRSVAKDERQFNRCLKEGVKAIAPPAPAPELSASPPERAVPESAAQGKVIWLLGPEEEAAAASGKAPEAPVAAHAGKRKIAGVKAALPGSDSDDADDQPVRVIEREIPVPGGGVLKVREFIYE